MDALIYKDTIYGGGGSMRGNYFNPIIYSTEERVVGVGENDKPLYQKTVTSNTLAAETGETVLTGIDSLKVLSSRTNTTYPFYISTYNVGGSGTEYGMVRLDTNGAVLLYNASRSASVVIEAVLQYTKTSDVAGSGSYNTLGVPNVHYTTEEQVIGTWIDGKTLYQKTFSFTIVGDNSYQRFNHGISNADTIFIDQGASYVGNSTDGIYPISGYTTPNAITSQINALVFTGGFDYRANSILNGETCVITLKYTKTS